MRFVIAIVLFLLAFLSIGYGIAQRTILAGPASFTTSVTTDSSAPITIIDGANASTRSTGSQRSDGLGQLDSLHRRRPHGRRARLGRQDQLQPGRLQPDDAEARASKLVQRQGVDGAVAGRLRPLGR